MAKKMRSGGERDNTPSVASESISSADDKLPRDLLLPDPMGILQNATPPIVKLVDDCLFVLDTNALLAPYDIGATHYDDIKKIIGGLVKAKRLFIPEQVLREYLSNRESRIRNAFDHIHTRASQLPSVSRISIPMLEERSKYKEMLQDLDAAKQAVKKWIESLNDVKDVLKDWSWDDPISTLYADLFQASVVIQQQHSVEELRSNAEWRKKYAIPPGYKDSSKADGGLGDLVIWFSIVELGKQTKRNVVFVTDESKPDWWVRSNDELLMPRQELCFEFKRDTNCHFGMLSFKSFLERAGAQKETVERAEEINLIETTDSTESDPYSKVLDLLGRFNEFAH